MQGDYKGIHGIQEDTGRYRGIQGDTGDTEGYRGIQWDTGGYRGYRANRGYRVTISVDSWNKKI